MGWALPTNDGFMTGADGVSISTDGVTWEIALEREMGILDVAIDETRMIVSGFRGQTPRTFEVLIGTINAAMNP